MPLLNPMEWDSKNYHVAGHKVCHGKACVHTSTSMSLSVYIYFLLSSAILATRPGPLRAPAVKCTPKRKLAFNTIIAYLHTVACRGLVMPGATA